MKRKECPIYKQECRGEKCVAFDYQYDDRLTSSEKKIPFCGLCQGYIEMEDDE